MCGIGEKKRMPKRKSFMTGGREPWRNSLTIKEYGFGVKERKNGSRERF
jgi:hypothetical protein